MLDVTLVSIHSHLMYGYNRPKPYLRNRQISCTEVDNVFLFWLSICQQ